jgi:hypothetical protein
LDQPFDKGVLVRRSALQKSEGGAWLRKVDIGHF